MNSIQNIVSAKYEMVSPLNNSDVFLVDLGIRDKIYEQFITTTNRDIDLAEF